jgi:hypothetical protein
MTAEKMEPVHAVEILQHEFPGPIGTSRNMSAPACQRPRYGANLTIVWFACLA